jgi:hypothetical protein
MEGDSEAGKENQDDVEREVFLGRLRAGGVDGWDEGNDRNAKCQSEIKNASFRGSYKVGHEL